MAFLEHTLGILLHPDSEWKAIRNERHSFKQVFLSHVPILALIPPSAFYYGVTQVGWSIGDGAVTKLSVESALILCVMAYFALIIGIFVLGEFINWMSKTYGVQDDAERSHYEGTALAVYVTTPILLAGIVGVYPVLWMNTTVMLIAAAYSVYLIYEGIPILMNIDKERAFMFANSVVTIGLVMIVVVLVSTVIIWGMGIGLSTLTN